jgi:type I restriction enzyme S subunit
MPILNKSNFESLSFEIPQSIEEQKAIAAILTAFDDKIENLQAQNKTLESIAQTIFKEWFGKYQIGDDLPEGWRVGKLGEVVKICGGTTPSTKNINFWNGNIHWTSPKDLSNSKEMFLLSTQKKITEEGLKQISSGLLPKKTLLLSSRAPVGYVSLTNIKLAVNQGFIALYPNQYLSNNYMYLWLKTNMRIVENAANGSTFLEISKTSFRNINCIIPEKNILNKFDNLVNPLFQKTLSNLLQIQTLKQTRDTLLPKLMSGQIRAEEFKK